MTIVVYIPGNVVTIFKTEWNENVQKHNTYQGVWKPHNDIFRRAEEFHVRALIDAAFALPVQRVTLETNG